MSLVLLAINNQKGVRKCAGINHLFNRLPSIHRIKYSFQYMLQK
jgi:hypothetical protein